MSSGRPSRRRGVASSMAVRSASSVSTVSSAEVAIEPVAIPLTRMCGARSAAMSRVRWLRAAFAVP